MQSDYINATERTLRVYEWSEQRFVDLEPSGHVAGIGAELTAQLTPATIGETEVPLYASGKPVTGLPDEQPGVFYVVEPSVAEAVGGRSDLLICGSEILDYDKELVGYRGLVVPRNPVATGVTFTPTPADVKAVVALMHEVMNTLMRNLLRRFPPEMVFGGDVVTADSPTAAGSGPRVFTTKEDLAALKEEWKHESVPWTWLNPFGLCSLLLAQGLITAEEMDLAEQAFGDDWMGRR